MSDKNPEPTDQHFIKMPTLSLSTESWPLTEAFSITGYTMNEIRTLYVEIANGDFVGKGEAAGIYYTGETAESIQAQVESVRSDIEQGADRLDLLLLLPSGGARNAIDAALWDLEAKQAGKSVWELARIEPGEAVTVATVGIGTPAEMAAKAREIQSTKIKLKVSDDQPLACISAVRTARPDAEIVIDVNQGWSFDDLVKLAPDIKRLGVSMIEQPLPRAGDAELEGYRCQIPLCADESCLDISELDQSSNRYDMINIKLDKVGGLTAGLDLASKARSLRLGVMVGNMAGTSLAMAPGLVLAQLCDYVDLDGPLLLSSDREHPLQYDNGVVSGLTPALWG